MNSKMILISYFSLIIPIIIYFGSKMKKDDNKWYKKIADFIEDEDMKTVGKEKLKTMVNKSLWYMLGISILSLAFILNYFENNVNISTSFIMVALPIMPLLMLEIKLQSFRMLEKDTK